MTNAGSPSYLTKHTTIITRASRPGLCHQHNIIHKHGHTPPSDPKKQRKNQQPDSSARPIKPPGVTYGLGEPPAYQCTLDSRVTATYKKMQMDTNLFQQMGGGYQGY